MEQIAPVMPKAQSQRIVIRLRPSMYVCRRFIQMPNTDNQSHQRNYHQRQKMLFNKRY